jgi:single-strand DNA-binding protein
MQTIVNKVQLIGNIGTEPEVRELKKGNKMVRISLATNEIYKTAQGKTIENTQWHNLVAWGKTAELVGQLCEKGKQIAVEGRLVNSSYTDKEGNKRYTTNIHVNEFRLLGKKEA